MRSIRELGVIIVFFVVILILIVFVVVLVVIVVIFVVVVVVLAVFVIFEVIVFFFVVLVVFVILIVEGVFFIFLVEPGRAGRGEECLADAEGRDVMQAAADRGLQVEADGGEKGKVDVVAFDVLALGDHTDVSLIQKVYWGRMQQTEKSESEKSDFF